MIILFDKSRCNLKLNVITKLINATAPNHDLFVFN